MQIPKEQVLDLLRQQGKDDQVGEADQQLPDQVDPEQHGNLLQKFGLNPRSEEHTSELQSRQYLVCRLLLEKKTDEEPPGWVVNRAVRIAVQSVGRDAPRPSIWRKLVAALVYDNRLQPRVAGARAIAIVHPR